MRQSVIGTDHHSRYGSERGAEHEGDRDHAINVHTHQLRGMLILGHSTHRASQTGAIHHKHQSHHDRQRHDENNDLDIADDRTGDEVRIICNQLREGVILATPDHHGEILQHDGHPDCGNQRGKARGVTQRAVGDALDAIAQHHAAQHRQPYAERQCQHQRHTPTQHRGERRQRKHRAYHHHFAMREVDQTEDTVHHRIAECD